MAVQNKSINQLKPRNKTYVSHFLSFKLRLKNKYHCESNVWARPEAICTSRTKKRKSKISIEEVKVKEWMDICHHFGSKENQTKKTLFLVLMGPVSLQGIYIK